MTIQEKIDEQKQNRAIALISKKGALESQVEFQDQIDSFVYFITNSDLTGIFDSFSIFLEELNDILSGTDTEDTFESPDLSDTQSNIETAITYELRRSIEDPESESESDSFYTTETSKNINTSSTWLQDNKHTSGNFSSSDIKILLTNILSSSINSVKTVRETQVEGSYVNRDEYNDPEKTNLEDDLTDVQTFLTSYVIFLQATENQLDNIQSAGGNFYFYENPDYRSEYPENENDSTTVNSYLSDLNDALTYLSSMGPSDDLTDTGDPNYNPDYVQSEFDALIGFETTTGTLYTLIENIESFLSSRVTTLRTYFFLDDLTSGFRKYYYFWVKSIIEKPQSPMVSLLGAETAEDSADTQMAQTKEKLNELLSGDTDQYLPTPILGAVYIDEESRILLSIISLPIFDKLYIHRKEITSSEILDNDEWSSPDITIVKTVSEQQNLFEDSSILDLDSIYLYRLEVEDSSIDTSTTTTSLQSDTITDQTSFDSIVDGVVTFPEEHTFTPGESIYINGGGIYTIISKTSLTCTLNDLEVNKTSDYLYRIKGILFT